VLNDFHWENQTKIFVFLLL